MNDIELAKRLSETDPDAIGLLVADHHASVFRFLRQLTRHTEDAEDLAQMTLVRVIEGAKRFDGRASLRGWILAIAFHEFTKFRRRRLWLPLRVDRPALGNDYDRLIEADALLDALARLPSVVRAAFLLHYVEDLSIGEIARSLGIPEGTVKSRLHTARTRLGALLEEEVSYATNPCQP